MKFVSWIALLLAAAQTVQAQMPPQQHVIVCFTVVDGKGNPLPISGDNALEVHALRLNYYPFNVREKPITDNFAEWLVRDEKDSTYSFITYTGYTAAAGYPFPDNCCIVSVNSGEFTITKPGPADTTMRIILRNHQRGRAGKTAVYLLQPVVFKPGTYEMDCSKTTFVKNAVYNNRAPLRMFRINRQPVKKTTTRIRPAAFSNYRLIDYTFYNDSLFKFSGYGQVGEGVCRLTPEDVTFIYKHASRKIITAVSSQSAGDYNIQVRVLDEKDSMPVYGAVVTEKRSRKGSMTDADGWARLKLEPGFGIATLAVSSVGYTPLEIQVKETGHYAIVCMLNSNISYIDSGRVEKGVFTDFTKDYIGIYWLRPGEVFSLDNQEQMEERKFYPNKRLKFYTARIYAH